LINKRKEKVFSTQYIREQKKEEKKLRRERAKLDEIEKDRQENAQMTSYISKDQFDQL
jgi:hypothetical protein